MTDLLSGVGFIVCFGLVVFGAMLWCDRGKGYTFMNMDNGSEGTLDNGKEPEDG